MKSTFILLSIVVAGFQTPLKALAQMPVPPPAPEVQPRSPAELDQILAPIALYPDPLIAQILPAATLPAQIVLADRYLQAGGDPNLIEQQGWDPSIEALARYPWLLKWMDDNLGWTTVLGQAFLYQPQDVMDSIQRLRAQAQALGNLQSTPQQEVVEDDGCIDILPANPEVIYVPVYQPDLVYFQRAFGNPFVSFGVGFPVGAWLDHDCDWHDHHLITWSRDQPRPADWWSRRPSDRRASQAARATVWRPHSPSDLNSRGEDRGWNAPSTVRSTVTVIGSPSRGGERPRPSAPSTQRLSPAPSQRPATGALIGVQSSQATRQFSSRGQQSRQATVVSRPAATSTHSAAPAHSESSRPAASSGKR